MRRQRLMQGVYAAGLWLCGWMTCAGPKDAWTLAFAAFFSVATWLLVVSPRSLVLGSAKGDGDA